MFTNGIRSAAIPPPHELEIPANPPPPTHTFRRLLIAGLTRQQAGNLTARTVGLTAVRSGWSPAEIQGLCFLRHLVEHERIRS